MVNIGHLGKKWSGVVIYVINSGDIKNPAYGNTGFLRVVL